MRRRPAARATPGPRGVVTGAVRRPETSGRGRGPAALRPLH